VKIYSESALAELHILSGLEVVRKFGNYNLDDFYKDYSPRIVIVSKKK